MAKPANTSASGTFGVTMCGQRQQFGLDCVDGLGLEEPVSALGDHHRIDDNVGQVELGDCSGYGLDDGGAGEHADLDGVGADIRGHRLDLRSYQIRFDRSPHQSRRGCSGRSPR